MALYLLGNPVPLCTGSPEQRITMHNVRTSSCPKASPEPRVTCGTLEGSMGTLTLEQGLGEGCPSPSGFDGLHLQNEIHTGHACLKVILPLISLL